MAYTDYDKNRSGPEFEEYGSSADVSELVGKTLTKIDKTEDEIIFHVNDGTAYKMYHSQDCCESVDIDDIVGELDDLVGSEILKASEDTNGDNPKESDTYEGASFTWTFYNFATINGYVTIKWYGSSNGYYSESVDFIKNK